MEYTQSQLTALTAANAALTAEKNAVETHQRSLMAELAGLKERHGAWGR